MNNLGLFFIILAALSSAAYNFFQKKASIAIHPMWGLTITSVVALIIGLLGVILLKSTHKEVQFSMQGAFWILLVGIAASGINVFYLLGYSNGAPIGLSSIVSTLVGTTATVLLGILLFNEGLSLGRLIGFILIVTGALVLQLVK